MYILEGNIGAGKSTFLTLLQQHLPSIDTTLEPIHNWQKKVYGQSLLANFYQDPKRWAYSIETFTMICRVHEHLKDQELSGTPKIIERSIYSGHYCFALTGYKNGFMSNLEWNLYSEWFNLLTSKCRPPKGFIYLQTNPEIAYERIKKRNRLAEKKITYSYLQQIHEQHEHFLIGKKEIPQSLQNVPVLLLNCDEEFEANMQVFNKHAKNIEQFITQTNFLMNATPSMSLSL